MSLSVSVAISRFDLHRFCLFLRIDQLAASILRGTKSLLLTGKSQSSMIWNLAISPAIKRTGRWQILHVDGGANSLLASWCGASLSFIHTGSYLGVRIGPLTERKERLNGGTPMLACIISNAPNSIERKETKLYHDLEPSSIVELFVAASEEEARSHRKIELVLIDWASVLEIEGFYTESPNNIMKLPSKTHSKKVRVLHIGDSISCGGSDGSQPIPRGCLDAFPFIARDILLQKTPQTEIEINLIALPGVSLTGPMKIEVKPHIVTAKGMKTRFWDASPWSDSEWKFERQCTEDILVVALGTNDETRRVDAHLFQDELCSFISKVHQLNINTLKHVVILYPFTDFSQKDFNDDDGLRVTITTKMHGPSFLDKLRKLFPLLTIDLCDIGKGINGMHTMDGLHPTVEGHKILGKLLANELQKSLRNDGRCAL